ncbi:phosphocholine cytidylyltransferase family protein [Candidatus Dojkabacteria bacterium]|nr:phosphocholine cytidylyltransferase family protein [Candidatus Dojkabacteria bacterium]
MNVIILAAGMGTRLGSLVPKPLTPLKNEETILDYQLKNIAKYVDLDNVILVVGYKFYSIIEKFPNLMYVYNQRYTQTNTAKSLLMALKKCKDGDTIWMNGDVYFDHRILQKLMKSRRSTLAVDNKKCSDEEIKYTLHKDGFINELSKTVKKPVGEALGINLIKAKDTQTFINSLQRVEDTDYFEKALENLTTKGKLQLKALNVENLYCKEIDFPEDLEEVKSRISRK